MSAKYAVNGRQWRCVNSDQDLIPGETFYSSLPTELLTPSTDERNEAIRLGVGYWLDSVVQGNGYDNIVSCASYSSSADLKRKTEAIAAIAWRDAVWSACYLLQANPPQGVTTLEQVIALLPKAAQYGWMADPVPTKSAQGDGEPLGI